jgi:hypothetical protein
MLDCATNAARAARFCGDVAQMGERLVRNEEVSGSIPLISTTTARPSALPAVGRLFPGRGNP